MSDSRRAQTIRRLTGGALLALCIGLAIERAGAQQQGSAGANVNVISGTGADGDWTLQRQNEPSMACSSRNPQNCLAGANDYRTVDIPFPTSGEKVTGDAWLGWYTTKNGGLTWRTRLLPGYPQDTSAAGLASPLRGYAAGADPVIRPGTNGLFYYGGLVFNREEGGGSAIFVARFIDNNNQEGTAGEPIDYLGASIVHGIGAAPTVVARASGARRAARAEPRRRAGDRAPAASTRAARVRAGVEQPGDGDADGRQALDRRRRAARGCADVLDWRSRDRRAPPDVSRRTRVHGLRALRRPGRAARAHHVQLFGQLRRDVERAARAQPRAERRRQRRRRGEHRRRDARAGELGRTCGQTGFNPNADTNNDCKVDSLDLTFVGARRRPARPHSNHASPRAPRSPSIPQTGALQVAWRQFNDGVPARRHRRPCAPPTAARRFSPTGRRPTLEPVRAGHDRHLVPHQRLPDDGIDGTGRAYLAWSARGFAVQRPDPALGDGRVVLSRRRPTAPPGRRQAPVDNQGEPGHQIMPALTFAQGKLQLVYYDLREDVSQLFGPFVDELPILTGPPPRVRHTVDVWAAQADPGANPAFTPFRLSQYRFGGVPGAQTIPAARVQPAEPADLPGRHVAVHGRLPRRGAGSPVCPQRIDVELQHRRRGESRVPRHLDGQPRHPAAGQRRLDRLHAAESAVRASDDERLRSDADRFRRACRVRPGCAIRTSIRRASPRGWSSARSATRAGSATFSAASRSSRRTTARRSAAIG